MRVDILAESLDIFHRDEFADPGEAAFKFDRNACETVGLRGRHDPSKEPFIVDDQRDGFADRQGDASICPCVVLGCHYGCVFHRRPPCGGGVMRQRVIAREQAPLRSAQR